MPIRTIETAAALKPWLPSDYSATGWDDTQIDAALAEGNDPRLIAAEIWEEYALSLPTTEADGSDRTVKGWTNIDVSVEYGTSRSPREHALRQAQFHRARSKAKFVRQRAARIEGEEPEGLIAPAPEEG